MKTQLRWVLYTLLFPLSQLGLLWEIMILTQPGALGGGRVWLLACGVLLALCAGADVLLFRALRQSTRLKIAAQRQALLEQSVEAQRRRGEALREEAEAAAGIRRELALRLDEAARLVSDHHPDDARRCMDSAARLVPTPERLCENPVADAILSEKLALCRREGIRTDCRLRIPGETPLTAAELCALLANLMDNAMAACRALPEEDRWIEVRGMDEGGFLVLRVRNSAPEEPAPRRRGSGLSRHGWGLEILRQIAQRHGGRMETEPHDGTFSATLWLPMA